MQYTELLPKGECGDLIQNFWLFEYPKAPGVQQPVLHRTLPQASLSVVYIEQPFFRGIRLLGPQRRAYQQEIHPGSVFLGIRFQPWTVFAPVLGAKTVMVDKTLDLPAHLTSFFEWERPSGAGFEPFCKSLEQRVESLFGAGLIGINDLGKFLCLRLLTDIKISTLVGEIPMAVRPLQKQFKQITGLTMTEFRNIGRLERTIKNIYLQRNTIYHSALYNGYTDHAHFINTFKKHLNMPIKDFIRMTDKIDLNL